MPKLEPSSIVTVSKLKGPGADRRHIFYHIKLLLFNMFICRFRYKIAWESSRK